MNTRGQSNARDIAEMRAQIALLMERMSAFEARASSDDEDEAQETQQEEQRALELENVDMDEAEEILPPASQGQQEKRAPEKDAGSQGTPRTPGGFPLPPGGGTEAGRQAWLNREREREQQQSQQQQTPRQPGGGGGSDPRKRGPRKHSDLEFLVAEMTSTLREAVSHSPSAPRERKSTAADRRDPKVLMFSKHFVGSTTETQELNDKGKRTCVSLLEFMAHAQTVLADFGDGVTEAAKARQLIHALGGSAAAEIEQRGLIDPESVCTPEGVFQCLFDRFLEPGTGPIAYRECARLSLDDYGGSQKEAVAAFFQDFHSYLRLGGQIARESPAASAVFLYGAMPQEIQAELASSDLWRGVRAMTWEGTLPGRRPRGTFQAGELRQFIKLCMDKLTIVKWTRQPGRHQPLNIPGDTRISLRAQQESSNASLSAPGTPGRQFKRQRVQAAEQRTMTVMREFLTDDQRRLLRNQKKCFKCFGDYQLCGGVNKCTNPPRSAATSAILAAIGKLGPNPQVTMMRLLNVMEIEDEQSAPEDDDTIEDLLDSAETAVLAHLEATQGEGAAARSRDVLNKMEVTPRRIDFDV